MTTTTTHPDWLARWRARRRGSRRPRRLAGGVAGSGLGGRAAVEHSADVFGGDGLDRVGAATGDGAAGGGVFDDGVRPQPCREAAVRWLLDPRPVGGLPARSAAGRPVHHRRPVAADHVAAAPAAVPGGDARRPAGQPARLHRLDGEVPWVTGGADHADLVVTGAALSDDRQIVLAVPRTLAGVTVGLPLPLAAVVGSRTACGTVRRGGGAGRSRRRRAGTAAGPLRRRAGHLLPGDRAGRRGGRLPAHRGGPSSRRGAGCDPARHRADGARDRLHALAGEATPDADAGAGALRVDCTRLVLRATQLAVRQGHRACHAAPGNGGCGRRRSSWCGRARSRSPPPSSPT
ncbi:MAG: hypothetical protein U0736_00205 [Gemmataceae bacterium]